MSGYWKRGCARLECRNPLPNPKRGKFCSRACLNLDARDRMRDQRTCDRPGCFLPKRNGSRFCSEKCSKENSK